MSAPLYDVRPRPFCVFLSSEVPLSFYVPATALKVNGYQVPIDNAHGDFIETSAGSWWCVIRSAGAGSDIPFRATIMRESLMATIVSDILYSFKVADLDTGADLSDPAHWHECAYGEVTLSGVEDFVRLAPFQLVRVRYADSGVVKSDFRVYVPRNGSVQYNGTYISFSGVTGNWYIVDPPASGQFSVKFYLQDSLGHLTTGDVPSGATLSFPVCDYAPDDGGGGDDDDDDSYDYDDSSSGDEDIPLAAPASPPKVMAPRDADSPRLRPFGAYKQAGSVYYSLYLPPDALNIGSDKVYIEGVSAEGYKSISSASKYWCAVYCRAEGDPVPSGYSAEFYARIQTTTGNADEVYSFPVAEVKMDGAVQEFAYGSVILSGLKPFRRLVPFEMVAAGYRDEGKTEISYRLFTPPDGTIQYNGKYLRIKEATGSWTVLAVDENNLKFFCTIDQNEEAHVNSDSSKYGEPGVKACFPVAELRLWGDWGWVPADILVGEISAVVVGIRQSTVTGFNTEISDDIGAKRFADMLKTYTSDVVVLLNEEGTVKAVKNAFERAAKSPGMSILYISCHGYCDGAGNNEVGLYDDLLTDAEVWEMVKSAKGKVFLVFDCCQSGSMWGPPGDLNMGRALKRLASRDSANVTMLCWSGANDEVFSWTNMYTGGYFTSAICRYASKNKTYSQIWDEMENDEELMEWDTPEQTAIGTYWDSAKFLNLNS